MKYKKVVIKIGSQVLTQKSGKLDLNILQNIVEQISILKKQGVEVVLVSSGAVAAGRAVINSYQNQDQLSERQVLASIGQVKLISTYSEFFLPYNLLCSQLLATKEDFRDRDHYLNMKNAFQNLLRENIIPIVNENDVIGTSEISFTDNDELAGLIASMLNFDALIILTGVDGIFTGDPKDPASKIIKQIKQTDDIEKYLQQEKSSAGRGGMQTKCHIARRLASLGINTHIINGNKENIILNLFEKNDIGSTFVAEKSTSSKKRWIASSEGFEKEIIIVNQGAKEMLTKKGKAVSILPVGIIDFKYNFSKGDILSIEDEKGEVIGFGKAGYSSQKLAEVIGKKDQKPLIHYDNLFVK